MHETHEHVHGDDRGQVAVLHEDHVDYLHDGHVHNRHDGHYDESRSDAHLTAETHHHEIEVCSGDNQRHRLSRAGDRQLNYACT